MKYLFLLLFASFMLALPTVLDAQCPTGDVTLSSQAEVDNFAVNYPNCSQITGFLTISGNDITDLSPLANLSSVGTHLSIVNNAALTSLQGLNNLSSLGSYLSIQNNAVLTSLQGLNSLSSLESFFSIQNNAALTSLQGLNNLSDVATELWIVENNALTSLQGLDNLSSVGTSFSIIENDALTSLQGVENLSSVGDDLFIDDNPALTNIQGLSSLSSLGGDFWIEDNGALTSLNGPNMLTSIGGTLWIGRNDALTSLNGLNNISSVGGQFSLVFNNALTSLNGLGNLSSVASFIIIGSNPSLTSLNGFESLSSVGTDISIVLNGSLTSITSLSNLSSMGGRLEIRGNNALSSIEGLSSLTSLDRLLISDNEVLTNLQGLENLSSVSNSVDIKNNALLTSLAGLDNLSFTGGYLWIWQNDVLNSISVLNNLTSIGGDLLIGNNPALPSLAGLENISSIGGYLYIGDNDVLTSLQELNNISSVEGYLSVNNNDALTSLQGLNNISSVQGYLSVNNNDALTSLQGLNNISSVQGYLSVNNNDALTSLQGLNNISSVPGYLSVNDNDALTSLQELNNISSVQGYLSVNNNDALTNLQGLNNISSVQGYLSVNDNDALTSLQGLSNLSSVPGYLSVNNNDALTNLQGLNNISSVQGYLSVNDNDALTSLQGLSNISSVPGYLSVNNNDALTNLQGLNNISSVASDLRIENNGALTSLQELNNLSSVGGELRITDNPTLSTCSIDWICDNIYFPYQPIIISNNATGCNSKDEVEDDCPNLYEPVCQNTTVALLSDGTASITPSEVDGGSIDVASSFVFPSDFTCEELGANIVSFVVIDIAGNIGACDATVTVEDPNDFCPDCTTYSATDNPQPVPVFGSGSLDCSSATTSTVEVDLSGQIGAGLTGIDYVEIDITHTWTGDLTLELRAPSGASITLSSENGSSGNNYTGTRFEDGFPSINSANAPFTGTFEPEQGAFNDVLAGEEIHGTWTLYICDDAGGDIGTLNLFTLKICSTDAPASPSITCPPDQMGSFDTDCQYSIPDYRSLATVSNFIGSSPTITQSPPPGTQINGIGGSLNQLITITAADAAGNSSDCTFNLTVNDDIPPTISCPAGVTQTVDAGQTYATVVDIAPASSDDNCASPTITHTITGVTTGSGGSDASGTQFNIGSSVVTYTVTDAAGLIGNCSFTVDVSLDCGSILVNSTADNLTPGDGNCTLREAIRNVNAGSDLTSGDCNCGNTITFDASTNGTPIVLTLTGTGEDAAATGDLDITADVTITGNGSGNTIINGNDIDRVFHLPPAAASLNVTLEHLTVKDGLLTGFNSGGGLNSGSNNANLIISNCAFDSNQASSNGGGLRIESASTVEIDNCLFNGNITSESYGGGVSLSIGAYTIRNCFFQNNQADVRGGGAATHSGAYTFINCTMTGNTATNGGGAIENSSNSGSVTLTNCTIAENTSINGAAVDINNNNAFLSLTNNIIVNNISSSDLKIVGVSPQVNVQNIVESCSISCPTFFSTSDDVICGLSTCANGLSYYPVIPNSDADGTADTSTPLTDDICGNSRSTSSYNIGSSELFFTDNENPVAICPATQTVSNDAGECGANVSFTVPDPTDNCSATSSASPASGSFFNVGTTQITVTATDGTGNTSQCAFDVIVNDTENPTISCPADVTQTVDAGQTYATVINIAPASSDDNCASPTITHTISGVTTGSGGQDASGTQFNIGSSVVTYTIEDASNNTASCSFNVEVNGNAEIDVQDPDMNSLTNNASNYDFGNVDIMGGSASGTFTINNIGDIALLLDGSPTVAISGSASFSVFQPSLTSIAPAGATTFQIAYNPANDDCSQQMATISIDNNDADENPFVFTVSATPIDNVNPTDNCPANVTRSNDMGDCGANVTFSIPDPSDNCPGVSAMASPASGSFFDVGTTQVTVTATDATGNTSQCTFDVVVNDTENPSANCPGTQTVSNDAGECGAVVSFSIPDPADNCPDGPVPGAGATASANTASGSFFDVGTTQVTVTATDAANNTSQCTFDVVVNDTENPTAICPATQNVSNDAGECRAIVNFSLPAPTDNCLGATASASPASGSFFDVGTTQVTVTATDAADNTNQCTFDVVVNDNEDPVVNCPGTQTVSNDPGECGANVSFTIPDPTDNCSATYSASPTSGSFFDVGTTQVTVTATDASGNTSQCTFDVVVNDTENPTANCPGTQTVSNDPGECGANVSFTIPDPADNCPVSSSASPASGSFFDVGTTQVTVTATDAANNTSQCTFDVVVNDTENPVANCPADITVNAEAGQPTADVSFSTPSPSDNCTGATAQADIASGAAFPLGQTTVTITATDASDNSSSCTFSVTVNDAEAPTADCPENITVDNEAGLCGASVSFTVPEPTDNAPGATASASPASGTFFDVGTTQVTVTATDVSGNTNQCTFDVVVNDTENPTANCPTTQTVSNDAGECGADVSFIIPDPTDNCSATASASHASGSFFDVGTTQVTATATDVAGNTSQCTFDVVVNDTENPTAVCPTTQTVSNDPGQCGAIVNFTVPAPADNCPDGPVPGAGATSYANPASGSFFDVGTTQVTATATDVAGNTSQCTFDVVVNDTENPTAVCPTTQTVSNDPGQCGAIVNFTVPAPMDNCPDGPVPGTGANASASPASGSFFSVGTTPVTVTATDAAGNTSQCTFDVVVNDTENPTAVCPTTQTVSNDPGQCGAIVNFTVPAPMDNCPDGPVPGTGATSYANPASGSFFDVGTTPVTVTATDAAGNTSQCTFDVVVNDTENPTVVCPTTQTVSNDAGQCGAIVNFTVPAPTDNCPDGPVPGTGANASASPASGSFFDVGTTQVTVTATDVAGNTSQCTFDVVVNDTENPTVSCPSNISQLVDMGEAFATISNIAPTESNDNCIVTTTTHEITGATTLTNGGADASGTPFNIGTSVVTYTVTDAVGNTGTCSFSVNVNGNAEISVDDPNANNLLSGISNYDFGSVNIMGGSASGTFAISNSGDVNLLLNGNPDAVAISGSSSFSVTQPAATSVAPASSTTFQVSYNPANNDCGQQTATISIANSDPDENPFTFTVSALPIDNVFPTANCPDNISAGNDVGQCGASVSFSIPDSDDNCPGAASTANIASGSFFPLGTTTVTVAATDATGNQSTCFFDITVNDNEDPTAICPSDVIVNSDAGQCGANVSFSIPDPADNCQGAVSLSDLPSGSFFATGFTLVTVTATDAVGNSADCTFSITVNDNEAPTALCQDIIVQLDANGNGSASIQEVNNGSSDACGVQSAVLSRQVFTCADVGSNTETLTVTDLNGNVSTCNTTITVEDNVAPTALCHDIIVQLDANGNGSASAQEVNNGSSDACGVQSAVLSRQVFTCADVGSNNETLTVTDLNGNVSTCNTTIMVEDNSAPTALCQNITVQLDGNGQASIEAGDVDGGSTDNCTIADLSLDVSNFECGNAGNNTVTLTVTDQSGNTHNCTAGVSVEDNTLPTATCTDITANIEASGSITITASDVNGGSTSVCNSVSLSIPPTTFTCDDVGNIESVTLTVTDTGNGQTDQCMAQVTIADPNSFCCAPPMAVCDDVTVQLDASGNGSISVSDIGGNSTAECGLLSETLSEEYFGCSDVGSFMITYTITDVNGDSDNCQATITVEDNVTPAALCNDLTVQLNNSGQGSATPAEANGGSNDACGIQLVELSKQAYDCDDLAGTTATLTVTDNNGNTSTCISNITVEDNMAPLAVCRNSTVEIQPNGTYTLLENDVYDAVNSTDNCSITMVDFPNTTYECSDAGQTYNISVIVTDIAGNTDQCSANVTVAIGASLPGNWNPVDIGTSGMGNEYGYDPCSTSTSTEGEFTLNGSGNNATSSTTDNVAFSYQEICGNGSITAKIESVSPNGYGGLMIRESSAGGAKQVSIFSNLSNILRHEVRYNTNVPKQVSSFYKPAPIWLRLERQGDWIFAYYSTTGANFQFVHGVIVPMQNCVQFGLASFTYLPGQQTTATFSNVTVSGGSIPTVEVPQFPEEAATTRLQQEVSLYPNPANHMIQVDLSVPDDQPVKYQLLNTLGQPVLQEQTGALRATRAQLDVSGLMPGVYYLVVRTNGKQVTKHLVIAR